MLIHFMASSASGEFKTFAATMPTYDMRVLVNQMHAIHSISKMTLIVVISTYNQLYAIYIFKRNPAKRCISTISWFKVELNRKFNVFVWSTKMMLNSISHGLLYIRSNFSLFFARDIVWCILLILTAFQLDFVQIFCNKVFRAFPRRDKLNLKCCW